MTRELAEETGLGMDMFEEACLRPCARVCVRYPDVDFIYHMFKARLRDRSQPPAIMISER